MKRKMPSEIKIGNTKYKVVKATKPNKKLGEIDYGLREIYVSERSFGGFGLTASEQHETFWHEVVHGILNDMGHPFRDNERFVVAFSRRLNGVIESAKFDDSK